MYNLQGVKFNAGWYIMSGKLLLCAMLAWMDTAIKLCKDTLRVDSVHMLYAFCLFIYTLSDNYLTFSILNQINSD